MTIRMPSVLHEMVAEEMNIQIGEQRNKFKKGTYLGTRSAEVASQILLLGSADVKFPQRFYARYEKMDKKSPDKSYAHKGCKKFPGLVIEVAWSQRRLDLPELARE